MGNLLKAIVSLEAQGVEQAAGQVTASVSKIEGSLNSLQGRVQAFGGGISKFNAAVASSALSFNKVSPAVSTAAGSFNKMVPASNQATQSLANLGRVVQDAPFGFLGIANNLNPLVESFQRLKQSTGTTGGALKALGKSLIGPGGIGIAISVVSSLLIVFGDRLFGSSKKAKEAEDANKALAQTFANTAVKLTTLVGIVKNSESSYEDKKKALQALNQEYGQYLTNFGQEAITAENVGKAYENIVDQLLRQAVVKGIQDEIAAAVEETAKQLIALEKAEEKKRIQSSRTVATTKTQATALDDAARGLQRYNGVVKDGVNAEIDRQASIDDAIKTDNTYVKVLARIKAELMGQLEPLLNLTTSFSDLNTSLNNVSDTAKKLPELDIKGQVSFSEIEPRVSADVASALDRTGAILGQTFIDGMKNAVTTGADTVFDQSLFDAQKLEATFKKQFESLGLNFFTTAKIDFSKSFDQNSIAIQAQLDKITQGIGIAQQAADFGASAITSMFDAMLSGQSALQALGNAFKQLALDIIQAALKALIFKAITGFLNPAGAVGSGNVGGLAGALGGLGGGFSNTGGNIGGLGLGGQSSRVEFRIRGNDLVGALASTSRSQNRLG